MSKDRDRKPPARERTIASASLLSDPFQDEDLTESPSQSSEQPSAAAPVAAAALPRSQSSARISYGRRNTTTILETTSTPNRERRPSASARDAYMQGLLQQLQSLESSLVFSPPGSSNESSSNRESISSISGSTITLFSDNAVAHSSQSWDRSILMPPLDRYHPMDDFAIFLLRRSKIHARNVKIIQDNARSHHSPVLLAGKLPMFPVVSNTIPATAAATSPASPRQEDTENSGSSSSLDVGGIAEYLRLKPYSSTGGKSPGSDHSRTTTSTSTMTSTMNNSSLSTFLGAAGQDSFGSLETAAANASRQQLQLAPMKEESPNSILELNSSSSSEESAQEKKAALVEAAATDHHCLVLDDDDNAAAGGTSSGDSENS